MRVVFILFWFIIGVISCHEATKPTVYEEPVVEITQDSIVELPVEKYGFSVIVTDEPLEIDLDNSEQENLQRCKRRYTSEIQKIEEPFTTDYEYRQKDLALKELLDAELNEIIENNILTLKALNMPESVAEINVFERQFPVFDSYAEASKAREKILQNN